MSKLSRRKFVQQSAVAGATLWAAAALDAGADEPKPAGKRLPVVALQGSPAERGITHGKTLKEPIHQLLKLWKADLADRYKMPPDAFIKKFVEKTSYLPAMKKWTPGLLEEINGIANGSEIDFETMLVFQLIDEYWVNGPGVAGEHCSCVGVSRRGGQPALIAQNMDLEGFRHGFQVILHVQEAESKLESLVLTNAGLIALNGMNNRSLGICCNTLGQLAYCRDGLPVACVVRGVLQQQSEQAAIDFLHRVKHASGQNYIIGGPDNAFSYECSAGMVCRFVPASGPDIVWHTNHPLVNDDYNPAYRKAVEKKTSDKGRDNSTTRLESVQNRLGKEAAPGLEQVKAVLAAKDSAEHPVSRPYKNNKDGFTFASTIMVLSEKPRLHVTAGPPDVHPYEVLSLAAAGR